MRNEAHKRAVFFWSWNGDLTEEDLRRQIGDFAQKGFAGFFICSRMGLKCTYMGGEWFRLCRVALEEARRYGMQVWLYDEDGWPSGTAGGEMSRYSDEAVAGLVPVYGWETVAAVEPQMVVAAFRCTPYGSELCSPEETPDWALVLQRDESYVNLLSSSATRHFLELSHERYREMLGDEFGHTIPGMFTDEPQLTKQGYPWSGELAVLLEERWGTDWRESLCLLEEESKDSPAFRHTYWKAVGDLFAFAYTRQISTWCEEHNLLFTGHFPCEDGLCGQLRVTGGVMGHYRYMHIPGIDYLGRRHASAVLLRQVSSAAVQMGRRDVLCETFGASGWQVSFGELGWNWGRQVALGINLPCLHLAAYSIAGARKKDHPVFFSEQEPWWGEFSSFVTWMNGIATFAMEGEEQTDVLLLSPLAGMRCAATGQGFTEISQRLSAAFRTAVEVLGDIQVRFAIGDDGILQEYGYVDNGRLVVGVATYTTVVVAETTDLTRPVWRLLQEFSAVGGRVVFLNTRPTRVEGYTESGLAVLPGTTVPLRADRLRRYFSETAYPRPVRVIDVCTETLAEGLCLRATRTESGWHLVLCTEQHTADTRRLRLELEGECRVFSLNPDFCGREEWPVTAFGGDTACALTLYPGQVLALAARRDSTPVTMTSVLAGTRRLTGWTVIPEDNCLTIDRASWRTGEEAFSEECALPQVLEALYGSGCTNGEVRYRFYLDASPEMYASLRMVIEKGAQAIRVNGRLVDFSPAWAWIDPAFREYDIRPLLRQGENDVDVLYTGFCPVGAPMDDTYEAKTNRFQLPVEPEAVYLRGTFVTRAEGGWNWQGDHYRVDGPFRLEPLKTPPGEGELTCQGYWFYRGNICFIRTFTWDGAADRVCLAFPEFRGTAVRCTVNDREAGLVWMAPFRIEITPWLKVGDNTLTVELLGSNRNLLGPHHHKSGTSRVVGRDTFAGIPGWEDFAQPELRQDESVWTDSYTVVPLTLGDVYVEEYRKV